MFTLTVQIFVILSGASMRNIYTAATAAALTAALCVSSLTPAVAEETTPLDAIPVTTDISAARSRPKS